jgi:hypothetical protein
MATTANININVNSKDAQGNVNKLTDSIKDAGAKSANLKTQLRQLTKELQNLEPGSKRFKELSEQANQLKTTIGGASKSSANLRLELKQITRELQNLEPGSARFRELSLRAGELKDQIADTNAVVGQLAGNMSERLVRGITGVVSIGVAGFQALTAGVALFGVENEELQKTMVQLQALMNLSQAVESFSGLDQKLVEIRASFQSLTTATNTQTLAQEGENVATAQGTVTTTALGTAMKALPIIAIAAAIGTLVYGIYQYVSANKEAEKQEEKRKKQLEETKKLQKENIEFVAKESVGFVSLINQLKATNINSKERKGLIKDINAQYGTTLKNISDETKFQQQLNSSVNEYIEYSRQKYKIQRLGEKEQLALGKQEKAQIRMNELIKEQTEREKEAQKTGSSYRGIMAGDLQRLFDAQKKIYDDADDRLQYYGKTILNIKSDIEGSFTPPPPPSEAPKELQLYANLLDEIKDKVARQIQAEEELEKTQTDRITNVQEREIKLLEQQYGDERQKLIDGSIQREIEAYEEKFKEEGKTQEEYDKASAEIKSKGDANLLDSEKKLLEQKKIFLDEDIKNIEDKYKLEGEIVINSITSIQDQTRTLELEFQKQQEINAINNSVLTEEKKQEAILEVKKKYLEEEIKLIKLNGNNQIVELGLQKDKLLQNEELTIGQRKEIETKYSQDVIKINQDTQNKVQEAIQGTKDMQESSVSDLTKLVDKVSEYVDKIAEIYSQFADILNQRNQRIFDDRKKQIDAMSTMEKESLDGQLKSQLITREQYDNKIIELDYKRQEEEKQLARDQFEASKRSQLINATIQGTQAVLAAYAAGAATPLIGPVITGPVYAAIAAAFAAAQIGIIANQQFTAARGGVVPGNGSGNIDSVPSMLAPGEFVINSQSSQMYPELLSNINQQGGGIKLTPDLPPSNTQVPPANVFQQDRAQQPIRAYVVESDVSSTQKRVDRIKRSVEF